MNDERDKILASAVAEIGTTRYATAIRTHGHALTADEHDKKTGKKSFASNRSVEYDTLSEQYARFLEKEILPEVGKKYKLRDDAAARAICGISSGGICAFTVAWERPNEFSKVLSWIGSFTNIASGKTVREGGHNYEAMVRKTPRKNIRIWQSDRTLGYAG